MGFEYFHKEVQITGKHSRYVDEMWEQNQIQNSFFKRLVDLYTIAPVIGLRARRRSVADYSDGKRTVPVTQMLELEKDLEIIMQTILLLDDTTTLSVEQKIDRAFIGPTTEEEFKANVNLFNDYLRGGIEVLYECLIERELTISDDYTDQRIGNMVAIFDNPLV
ncbi:hypothetical protein J2Z76_001118 [Sedimentibacter acidaminivorans]|uniref:Uncharacterized protein n=1 Tax=Sedimentibacter acidaminivorans TaxID=913099 RepID=A0ABS4GC45_9FIRM|nr:hypothetical protein [Sedimentibacter acidaminivorans]MBP1925261.1 hypothetical protein [Sedimentibacter acidaminivorans]